MIGDRKYCGECGKPTYLNLLINGTALCPTCFDRLEMDRLIQESEDAYMRRLDLQEDQ